MKRPARPSLTTKRLGLRLVEKSDLPDLFAVNGDAEVFRYSPRESWKTPADGKTWLSRIMAHRKSGATMQFVIILRETRRLAAFARYAFTTLGLKRLEAELDPRNAASARVLERVGFTREGLRRRNYFCKGEVTDTALYGMLSRDPRPSSVSVFMSG